MLERRDQCDGGGGRAITGHRIDDRILAILAEDGIDPQGQQEALVALHLGEPCDVLITLSEEARQRVPAIPCAYKLHCPFHYEVSGSARDIDLLYRLRNEVKYFAQKVADNLLRVLVA